VSKFATSTTEVASGVTQYGSILIVLFNLDVSGTIFKVLQVINLFDKLRLINIPLNGLLGTFLN
jgi:hypothetical protein